MSSSERQARIQELLELIDGLAVDDRARFALAHELKLLQDEEAKDGKRD